MTPEQIKQYYDSYVDMFSTDGWRLFQEDIKLASEAVNILSIQDSKELHQLQGRLDIFNRLINWQESIENAYQAFLEEQEEGAVNDSL
tara:strand:- start:3747 stop:4010 length:264 start_codon:yes stop_codon:yes gene_type:complete